MVPVYRPLHHGHVDQLVFSGVTKYEIGGNVTYARVHWDSSLKAGKSDRALDLGKLGREAA